MHNPQSTKLKQGFLTSFRKIRTRNVKIRSKPLPIKRKVVILHSLSSTNNLFIPKFIYIMYLDSVKKQEIFGQYGASNTDTGSAESQIALFSYRISHLTEHMRANRKDNTTKRALVKLVGKRRALLNYLKDRDINRYRAIVKALGLRK